MKKVCIFLTACAYAVCSSGMQKDVRIIPVGLVTSKPIAIVKIDGEEYILKSVNEDTLHYAVKVSKDLGKIKDLLKEGEDVDGKDDNGNTPLHIAVTDGSYAICKYLLEHRANANMMDKFDERPILHAARQKDFPLVKLLLQHGARNTINQEYWPEEFARVVALQESLKGPQESKESKKEPKEEPKEE